MDRAPTEALGQGLPRLAGRRSEGVGRVLRQKNVSFLSHVSVRVLEEGASIDLGGKSRTLGSQVRKDTSDRLSPPLPDLGTDFRRSPSVAVAHHLRRPHCASSQAPWTPSQPGPSPLPACLLHVPVNLRGYCPVIVWEKRPYSMGGPQDPIPGPSLSSGHRLPWASCLSSRHSGPCVCNGDDLKAESEEGNTLTSSPGALQTA